MNAKQSVLWGSAALAAGAAGLLLSRAASARRLHDDAARLFAGAADPSRHVYREAQLVGLPAPVRRYFRHVLPDGRPYLRGLRLRHHGQFKTDLNKEWVAISGEQYMTACPPGFIWQGSTGQFTARDAYEDGHGRLAVHLLGLLPVLHGEGPHYDSGELLRWLTESVLLPTALLPSDELCWLALDDQSARLLLSHHGQSVSCIVRFNEANEIEECEALRHRGDAGLQPWVGRFLHYRDWHGVHAPSVLEASWVVNGQRQPYARFTVQELEYDQLKPY
ncbi:DUF6544 family protein [Hymenobacter properus]|uniref:DUF3108 domain-containing protein n=1 Tax=Hymenobacter properus TaxID=2791026 RepID=A0A931FM95_9BACT|nr:DUF6544 family protein [Hymenobacter properus]MBF9142876.1 hypothetical protein [Hymenobacter properus]MBR7721683.1 hypothetical protein [Microvirga sp. SRT04]